MMQTEKKGRNTTREPLSELDFSPVVVYFTSRSSLNGPRKALRIGRLLYLPAAPAGGLQVTWLWRSVPSSDAAWAPLDLPSLVAEHLPRRQERVFWKLVLVLPDGEEQSPGSPSR